MKPAAGLADRAAPGLAPEIAGYRSLLATLEAESTALCRLDPDALTRAAEEKHQHVMALQRLAQDRDRALQRAGLPRDEQGLLRWLRTGPDGEHAAGAWHELRTLARSARDANERNGRLLGRQRRHFERALDSLLHAGGKPQLYGADGCARRASASRVYATT